MRSYPSVVMPGVRIVTSAAIAALLLLRRPPLATTSGNYSSGSVGDRPSASQSHAVLALWAAGAPAEVAALGSLTPSWRGRRCRGGHLSGRASMQLAGWPTVAAIGVAG